MRESVFRRCLAFRVASVLITVSGSLSVKADAQTFHGRDLDAWIGALTSEDVREQWYATLVLAQIGPGARSATAPLMELLVDRRRYEYVRAGAAFALGRIQPDPARVVPLLTETLSSELASVRRHSARALGRFGVEAKPAVPEMLTHLETDDIVFRIDLAEALWRVARYERAIPILIDQIRLGKANGGFEAAEALGRLAKEIPDRVIPALIEALGSSDPDVARSAARSLGRTGADAMPGLSEAVSSETVAIRRGAIEAYGWMGPAGASGLLGGLNDADPEVRRAAARGLGTLGPSVASVEPALLRAVNDPDPQVRATAGKALKRIGVSQ